MNRQEANCNYSSENKRIRVLKLPSGLQYLHLLILIIAFYTLVVGIESASQELWWCVRKHLVYHHPHYHQSQEVPLGNENCCNVTNGTNIPIFFSTTVSEKDITFEHVYGIWITRFGISVLVMSTLA